jgi:aspartate 1-decarboxylase
MDNNITVEMLKGKLHHARITDASIEYAGSIGISRELMAVAGFLQYEKVLVANVENAERFETYVIAEEEPGQIVLRGAAAHLGSVGDRIIIMSFARMSVEQAQVWEPLVAVLDGDNNILPKEAYVTSRTSAAVLSAGVSH